MSLAAPAGRYYDHREWTAGSRTATDEVEVAAQEEQADVLGVAADSMGSLAPAVSASSSAIDEDLKEDESG